jgi:glutamate/tyrosine decarboxylase-like PLP-dependent enzyme
MRLLDTDESYSLRGETLMKQIREDIEQGYIPFYVCGTLGTTSCGSFDNIKEIGSICQKFDIYLHVDAAYAGNALICEEFRPYMTGLEYIDSLNTCPNKWMLINFDCSCLWYVLV